MSVSMHVCLHCEWCVNMYICMVYLVYLLQADMVETETCNNGSKNVCETQLSVVYDTIRVGCLLDTLVYDYFSMS